MWLQIGSLHTKLARATAEERKWLIEYLSFKDASAHFRRAANDKICLFNRVSESFPSGLVRLVENAAPEEGFTVERVDGREPPCTRDPLADLAWLRDYQRASVDAVCTHGRGILWIPTGGGKTEIFVGLTRALPCRWLFIVHRATLMANAADRFELRSPGLRAGRIGDSRIDIPDDAQVVCATFQTIKSGVERGDPAIMRLLAGAQGLAVDEAHVLPASSFYRIVMSCPAYYRIGFSGTPLARGDRRSTFAIAALGPVIHRIRTEVLVDAGVLARARIRLVRCRQKSDAATWQGAYGEAVVRGAVRNAILTEACKRAQKPCLAFVKEIAHGRGLVKRLERAGLRVGFVHGKHSLEQRQRAKRDLSAGRFDVLVCSVVFQEGEDMPDLRSVVVGSAGKSVIASLQRIGRGMRTAAGKDGFEVFDVADLGCLCMSGAKARQHSGCKWLDKHTRERLKAYTSEGHNTVLEDWPQSAPANPSEAPVLEPLDASDSV